MADGEILLKRFGDMIEVAAPMSINAFEEKLPIRTGMRYKCVEGADLFGTL